MNSHVTPPKLLPLHLVGWLSLPWRHWLSLAGVLAFGLCFLLFSPAPFLVRLVVLVVPVLVAFLLTLPIGGLHLDEWLVLAVRFRMRTRLIVINAMEEEEQARPNLEELLEYQDAAGATTGKAPSQGTPAQQAAPAQGAQLTAGLFAQATPASLVDEAFQLDLAGTRGGLHRGTSTTFSLVTVAGVHHWSGGPPAPPGQSHGQKPSLAVRPPSPSFQNTRQPMSNAQLWGLLFARLFSRRSGKRIE